MRRIAQGASCLGFIIASFTVWSGIQFLLSAPTASSSGSHSTMNADGRRATAKATAEGSASQRDLILSNAHRVTKKDNGKETSIFMNDPSIKKMWGLEKVALTKAWDITQGSKDIVVAVIDTGIDKNHKDLQDNLWVNPGESGRDANGNDKANNGIDDDNNGYIDDVHGWNFVHNNNDLSDKHGHGTHIAGIVGARGGNGFGISGASPNVSLMALKYYDPNTNNLRNTIKAIHYVVQMKERFKNKKIIINYSGGGTEFSKDEYDAIKMAEAKGILFVSAAGNERSNSDEKGKHYYPADYELSNIISVTAVNKEETKVLASSNYGIHTVDLAAPGEGIYSTLPGNAFGTMTGTSQATAFVTGVAALAMAHNPEFTAADVKKYILRTGDEHPTLLSKTGTAKLLNSYKALTSLDMNVGITGVVAANTAAIPSRVFSSSNNIKDPKLVPSAFNTSAVPVEETTEAFAGFGKDLIRALKIGGVTSGGFSEEQGLR